MTTKQKRMKLHLSDEDIDSLIERGLATLEIGLTPEGSRVFMEMVRNYRPEKGKRRD